MKVFRIIIIVCLLGVVVLFAMQFNLFDKAKDELVYVQTSRVFSEFTFTKEQESKLQKVEVTKTSILDSLMYQLKGLEKQISMEQTDELLREYELTRQAYMIKQEQFQKENQALTQQYNEEIWNQLNQYIKEFGEANGYELIFGATGNGNLLYAREGKDVTDQVIKYVNNRYEGIE